MYEKALCIEAGPATLIPLIHIPLLKDAPKVDGEYKILKDKSGDGDLCHFYGDFTGYHLYFIVSSYKKKIVPNSIEYYDKKEGLFSISIASIMDDGSEKNY